MSLVRLAGRVRRDLSYLGQPARAWTIPRERDGAPVLDVLIVGGGQGGLAVAFGLQRERITNIRIVDRNRRGLEGPWRRFARMQALRTLKDVTGIDLGIPSLTLRAYCEARFGRRAWTRMEKVPRTVWQDYLDWFRDVLELPVENETELTGIEGADGLVRATLDCAGRVEQVLARKIVLATGIEGSGFWRIPAGLVGEISPERYAHAADAIDFAALAGRRVAVLGAGPSGFDNAAEALEAGAARVEVHFRRQEIPRVNPLIWMYFSGILAHFGALGDSERWRFMRHVIEALPAPPPQDVFWRCRRHDRFVLQAGSNWRSVREEDGCLVIDSGAGVFGADFIIFATGFETDLAARPELGGIVGDVALWRDRFTPPEGEGSDLLGRHPYLGSAFEFTERVPGAAPHVGRVHHFTLGALPSLGLTGGAITGIRYGVPRLVGGLARDLFREDAEVYYRGLLAYAEPELQSLESPSEWIDRFAEDAMAGVGAEMDDELARLLAGVARTNAG